MVGKTTIKVAICLAIAAGLASTAFFFFPAVKEAGVSLVLAIAFASSITQLGGVVFFLSSLRTFKPELKLAYAVLSIGLLLFSLVQLVPSLSAFTDILSRSTFISDLFFILPFAAGAFCMYVGVHRFARLLQVRSLWNSFWFALLFSAVIAAAVVVAPHPAAGDLGMPFWAVFGSVAWCAAFSFAALMVTLRIRQAISPSYQPAMSCLALALGMLAVTTFHEIVVKIYFFNSSYASTSLSVWPYLLVGILFLTAGVAFNSAGRGHRFVHIAAGASPIDVVVAVAQLVSRPAAVDVALDKVRTLTATRSAGSAITPEEKSTLTNVYLELERYLTTEEPLHTFTKEDLRASLPPSFVHDLR